MDTLSPEALDRVLPQDPVEKSVVLKRLVLTLRDRLDSMAQELRVTQERLCQQCQQPPKIITSDNPTLKKDLAAAVARAHALQADYDALANHFQSIKLSYQRIIAAQQQSNEEVNLLKQRNAEMVVIIESNQTDFQQNAQYRVLFEDLQREVDVLKQQNDQYFQAANQAKNMVDEVKLEAAQKMGQMKDKSSSDYIKHQKMETLFDSYQKQNEMLKDQMQQLFEITNVENVQQLGAEVEELRNVKQLLEEKLNNQALETQEKILNLNSESQLQRQKLAEKYETQQQQLQKELENNYKSQMNDIVASYEQQLNNHKSQYNDLHIQYNHDLLELDGARKLKQQFETQLQHEKDVFDKAKQKAKARNQILADQLEETLQEKDQLELKLNQEMNRNQELEKRILELQYINRMLKSSQEDIFLQQQYVNIQSASEKALKQMPQHLNELQKINRERDLAIMKQTEASTQLQELNKQISLRQSEQQKISQENQQKRLQLQGTDAKNENTDLFGNIKTDQLLTLKEQQKFQEIDAEIDQQLGEPESLVQPISHKETPKDKSVHEQDKSVHEQDKEQTTIAQDQLAIENDQQQIVDKPKQKPKIKKLQQEEKPKQISLPTVDIGIEEPPKLQENLNNPKIVDTPEQPTKQFEINMFCVATEETCEDYQMYLQANQEFSIKINMLNDVLIGKQFAIDSHDALYDSEIMDMPVGQLIQFTFELVIGDRSEMFSGEYTVDVNGTKQAVIVGKIPFTFAVTALN